MDKLHEECAVVGVSVKTHNAAGIVYNGLLSLQHRGQEGAGIAVMSGHTIAYHKDVGLVSEVFHNEVLKKLPSGTQAVGHNRYSTTGNNTKQNVQPFISEFLTGRIATVHNGNIVNAKEIRDKLLAQGLDFVASSDSEVISLLIAYHSMQSHDIVTGLTQAAKELKGAFSLVVLSSEKKLIAIRDAHGFRPLCIGESENGFIVASESCAIDSCGFKFVRDIAPGELVVIEDGKITLSEVVLTKEETSICVFEYVYFARPDSVLDGQSVYEARFRMGRELAREASVDADVVCGVPDSGLEAAMGYAAESGIPYAMCFAKNRYIGRSFIFPTPEQRANAVHLKLNPMKSTVAGKRVVLIDDSIVRGTTCQNIVKALKDAGAVEVHMRISSPPFTHTCHYGTDIDSEEHLVANRMSIAQIGQNIGADSLAYISVEGLIKACCDCNLSFCTHCFTGGDKDDCSTAKLQLEETKIEH